MESASAASSSAHLPQHLDRRNEPAPQVATYSSSETRQKIVEILASTANGCLAELGYFPGMPHKFKELEVQNKNWQTENVKLFEDNKRLMGMLNAQNESLKWMKVPEMEKIQRIKDLEQENQALRLQREDLLRRPIADGNGQPLQQGQITYAQLQHEHSNLLDTYRLAYNEVQRLRAFIAQNPQLHQQEPIRIDQQHPTPPPNFPQFSMPSATQVPHPVHQTLVQEVQQATPSITQGRRYDPQNAVMQHRQQQPGNIARRPTTGKIIIPPRPTQPAQAQPAPTPVQLPSKRKSMQGDNLLMAMENNIRNSKRGGNTYPSGLPSHPSYPSRSGSSPASPMGPALSPATRSPLSAQPLNAQFHPPPTSVPSMHPGPSTASPRSVLPTPPASAESTASSMALTIPPYDTYLNQQPGLTPALPSPAIAPQNASGPSNQSEPLSTPAPVPSPGISLKRDSISDQGMAGLTEEPNKKPRLQHCHLEPNPTHPIAGPSSLQLPEPFTEIPAPTSEDQEAMQVDGGDEHEGSEDDLIELGPDGLRLVKDCLAELFHEPKEDGSVICKLCEYRHAHGYQEEPPVQFVNPTDQQLEDHCVTEHEAAWSNLRNPDAE